MGKTDTKRNPVVDTKLGEKREGEKLLNNEREKMKEKKEWKIKKYIRPKEEEDLWMLRLAETLKGSPHILESLDIYPEIKEARIRASIGANI